MQVRISMASIMTMSFISGCAIHPLPQNYSGVATLQIVHSIRCETRDGFRFALGRILAEQINDDGPYRYGPETGAIGKRLQSGSLTLPEIAKESPWRKKLHLDALYIVNKLDEGSIGYIFDLTMSEENMNKFTLGVADNLLPGIFTGSSELRGNFKRQNQRRFRITDMFSTFYSEKMSKKCSEKIAQGRQNKNFLYPVTGKIGIQDTILNHFVLSDSIGLTSLEKDTVTDMSEKLEFTTTLYGDVKPTIALSPVTDRFHVTSVGGEFSVNRIDYHVLTVTLALAKDTWEPKDLQSSVETKPPRRAPQPRQDGSSSSNTRARVNEQLDRLEQRDFLGQALRDELDRDGAGLR